MSKGKTKGDEDKLARIHLVLNEEPVGADGDRRAMKRIREILYGKVTPVLDPEDDEEQEESDG